MLVRSLLSLILLIEKTTKASCYNMRVVYYYYFVVAVSYQTLGPRELEKKKGVFTILNL